MGGIGSGPKKRLSTRERKKRRAIYAKKWRQENKEKRLAYNKKWKNENKEKDLETKRIGRQRAKEKELKKYYYSLQYERNRPGRVMAYYYKNREKMLAYAKEYGKNHKEQKRKSRRKYVNRNKDKINAYQREYTRRKKLEKMQLVNAA